MHYNHSRPKLAPCQISGWITMTFVLISEDRWTTDKWWDIINGFLNSINLSICIRFGSESCSAKPRIYMSRMVINDVVIFICMRSSVRVTPSIIDAVQLGGTHNPKVSRSRIFLFKSGRKFDCAFYDGVLLASDWVIWKTRHFSCHIVNYFFCFYHEYEFWKEAKSF